MASLLDRTRFKLALLRQSGLGMLILLFVGTTVGLGYFGRKSVQPDVRSGTPVVATITAIRPGGSKYSPSGRMVEAQDGMGLSGRALVSVISIAGCTVGDRIAATSDGFTLDLDPKPCR